MVRGPQHGAVVPVLVVAGRKLDESARHRRFREEASGLVRVGVPAHEVERSRAVLEEEREADRGERGVRARAGPPALPASGELLDGGSREDREAKVRDRRPAGGDADAPEEEHGLEEDAVEREAHAQRPEEAEEGEKRPDHDRVGPPYDAKALGDVRRSHEGERGGIGEPPAQRDRNREDDERSRRVRCPEDFLAVVAQVDSRRARREDGEEAGSNGNAVEPSQEPGRSLRAVRRGRLGAADGRREEQGNEREREEKEPREERALAGGRELGEPAPELVARVRVHPVVRLRGEVARLVEAAREAVELRGSLVRQEEGKEGERRDSERDGRPLPAGAVVLDPRAERKDEGDSRERDEREDEPVDHGEAVQEEREAEPLRAPRAALSEEQDERLEEDRDPAREEVVHVRELSEPVRYERERDARDPRGARGSGQGASEPECPVAREREADERQDALSRQRPQSEREQREERQGEAVVVLAEGEGELIRKIDVPVEEVERRMERLVPVPPEDPRVQVRIAGVGAEVPEVVRPRPRHRDRQREEREEDERLAQECAAPGRRLDGHPGDDIGAVQERERCGPRPQPGAKRESDEKGEREFELEQQPIPGGVDLDDAGPFREKKSEDVERNRAADRREDRRDDAAPETGDAGEQCDAGDNPEAGPVVPREGLFGGCPREERQPCGRLAR